MTNREDDVIDQTVLNYIMVAVSGIIGWLCRELWGAVKALRTDLSMLREEIARDYTRKDDFRDAMRDARTDMKEGFSEIKEMLSTLFDRIDKKVDK